MDNDLDVWSLWEHMTWEGKQVLDGFNFDALRTIVDKHFGRECVLLKIAEGGYHKVCFRVQSEASVTFTLYRLVGV